MTELSVLLSLFGVAAISGLIHLTATVTALRVKGEDYERRIRKLENKSGRTERNI